MRSFIPKLFILALVGYAVVRMWHWPIGFTYFTQLSNLFIASAVLLQAFFGEGRLCALKFAAVVSILATFLVYLLFLAPFMPGGLPGAYRQDHYASLCMHLLVPAAALADWLLNDSSFFGGRLWPLYALLPPLCWFGSILILGAAGVRWNGMAAPYPFLDYLSPPGWFGFRPASADTPAGIGVFYSMLFMSGLFLAIGYLLQRTGRAGS